MPKMRQSGFVRGAEYLCEPRKVSHKLVESRFVVA